MNLQVDLTPFQQVSINGLHEPASIYAELVQRIVAGWILTAEVKQIFRGRYTVTVLCQVPQDRAFISKYFIIKGLDCNIRSLDGTCIIIKFFNIACIMRKKNFNTELNLFENENLKSLTKIIRKELKKCLNLGNVQNYEMP